MEKLKLTEIKPNPSNPRTITDDKLQQLVKSVKDFPQMLSLRPIVIDKDNIVLGGNMRLQACKIAGIVDIPVLRAENLTEQQKQEFIIKDNVGFGEWDWETLSSEWDADELSDWGLDVPSWESEGEEYSDTEEYNTPDYSDKNKEIDIDSFDDEMVMAFKFTTEEYEHVRDFLSTKDASKEIALLNLSGYEQ
jgi:hypothetical protein